MKKVQFERQSFETQHFKRNPISSCMYESERTGLLSIRSFDERFEPDGARDRYMCGVARPEPCYPHSVKDDTIWLDCRQQTKRNVDIGEQMCTDILPHNKRILKNFMANNSDDSSNSKNYSSFYEYGK